MNFVLSFFLATDDADDANDADSSQQRYYWLPQAFRSGYGNSRTYNCPTTQQNMNFTKYINFYLEFTKDNYYFAAELRLMSASLWDKYYVNLRRGGESTTQASIR